MHATWRVVGLMFAAALALTTPAAGEFQLHNDDRVVLFGDTVFYEVRMLEPFKQFIRTRYPDNTALVCNLGEKRSTMADAPRRLETEVLPLKPTRVLLCFGQDAPERKDFDAQKLERHFTELGALIDAIQARDIKVTLVTPPPPDESRNRGLKRMNYDDVIGRYAEATRKLAADKGLDLIDWFTAVQEGLAAFPGKSRPAWTQHGMRPALYSIAVFTELLLKHWEAEPLDYLVSTGFEGGEASATIGTAKVTERTDTHLDLALTGVPVVFGYARSADIADEHWPLAKWFKYRLQIKNVPAGGVIISSEGKHAKPFLAQQLEEGADMALLGPLVANEATRQLHEAVMRACNQFTKYRIAADREAPEPELVEGYRLLKEAEISMAVASHRIACRIPARFDTTLHIEVPKEMAKPTASPAPQKP